MKVARNSSPRKKKNMGKLCTLLNLWEGVRVQQVSPNSPNSLLRVLTPSHNSVQRQGRTPVPTVLRQGRTRVNRGKLDFILACEMPTQSLPLFHMRKYTQKSSGFFFFGDFSRTHAFTNIHASLALFDSQMGCHNAAT